MSDNGNMKSISELGEKIAEQEKGIHTDFKDRLTYGDYLQLDKILNSQQRLSNEHDEMLFIIIHQASELWMKLIIHEVRSAINAIENEELDEAFKMLARVTKIQKQLIDSWSILTTMTPSDYLKFRDDLGQASGFQSFQYRMLEFALGYKSTQILKIYENHPDISAQLQEAYKAPSIYDAAIKALHRAGLDINPELIDRDYTVVYGGDETVAQAWKEVYLNPTKYWDLYELAEKLMDIEDNLQQWRFRHMKTVERVIGFKTGTGGSSGVGYLKQVLDHSFFPELWSLRTEL